ncbi:MAG: hypothetical protein R3174_05985, partial [Gammaproteobacteria bacterium]|nr:hypothetical protein [Gammaproteobacteria bacterium]
GRPWPVPGGSRAGGESGVSLVGDRFALTVEAGGLRLVDLARAREVMVKRALVDVTQGTPAASRPLLLPMNLSVGEDDADAVEARGGMLARLGFEVRRTAPGALAIHAVPAALGHVPAAVLGRELVEWRQTDDAQTFCDALARLASEYLEDLMDSEEAKRSFVGSLPRHAEALDRARAWIRLDAADIEALLRGRSSGDRR